MAAMHACTDVIKLHSSKRLGPVPGDLIADDMGLLRRRLQRQLPEEHAWTLALPQALHGEDLACMHETGFDRRGFGNRQLPRARPAASPHGTASAAHGRTPCGILEHDVACMEDIGLRGV